MSKGKEKKYVYNLKFARGKKTFVVRSEPTTWLKEDGFRELLLKGVAEGGRFVESWRGIARKN